MPSARREKRFETTATGKEPRGAHAELQAWYFRGLRPKLARAASTGAVDAGAALALDAEVRALLAITHEQQEAA